MLAPQTDLVRQFIFHAQQFASGVDMLESHSFLENFHNFDAAWNCCTTLAQHENPQVSILASTILYDQLTCDQRTSPDEKLQTLGNLLFTSSTKMHNSVIAKLAQTYASLIIRKERYLLELTKAAKNFEDREKILIFVEVFRCVAEEFKNALLPTKTRERMKEDLESLKPVLFELIVWSFTHDTSHIYATLQCLEAWEQIVQIKINDLVEHQILTHLFECCNDFRQMNLFGTVCHCISGTFEGKYWVEDPPSRELIVQIITQLVIMKQRLDAANAEYEFYKFASD